MEGRDSLMIKAIIFDFFGVIGKSTHAMMREAFNLNQGQEQELKNLHKMLDYEFIGSRKYLEAFAKVADTTYQKVFKVYMDSKERFAHSEAMLNYINTLKKSYKIALLTNVAREAFNEFIAPVQDCFDVVITSYETKWAKPEAEIYIICAQKLGVDVSECVMIDDSAINCEGARTAGMQAIQFVSVEDLKKQLKEKFDIF